MQWWSNCCLWLKLSIFKRQLFANLRLRHFGMTSWDLGAILNWVFYNLPKNNIFFQEWSYKRANGICYFHSYLLQLLYHFIELSMFPIFFILMNKNFFQRKLYIFILTLFCMAFYSEFFVVHYLQWFPYIVNIDHK